MGDSSLSRCVGWGGIQEHSGWIQVSVLEFKATLYTFYIFFSQFKRNDMKVSTSIKVQAGRYNFIS